MVACRPLSGTSVPRLLATPRPQPRRPHSSVPLQWQPRTDGDPHAAQQRADQARATRFAQTDPNAASEQSSQPPLSRCCDDHLNPGISCLPFCEARTVDGTRLDFGDDPVTVDVAMSPTTQCYRRCPRPLASPCRKGRRSDLRLLGRPRPVVPTVSVY